MKKQVILNFLNLPGIATLGLMDGRSRPYFSGIDEALNSDQKEALTQAIHQVICTASSGFESLTFQFAHQAAHLYRLNNGVILLVVTDDQLNPATYNDSVLQLKETLETDPYSAISTFRLLAGSGPAEPVAAPSRDAGSSQPPSASTVATDTAPDLSTTYPWQDGLSTLNALTDATAQYLGKIVVANNWRNTRPKPDTLPDLQIDRGGHFSLSANTATTVSDLISAEDLKSIHDWVSKFTQRCSTIIRDYPEMVLRQSLTEQQRSLLNIDISE
jgi:hypothetical protein